MANEESNTPNEEVWTSKIPPKKTLKQLRLERGLVQGDLASFMKLSIPRVSEIEKAGFDQRISSIKSHVKALGGELHLVAEFPDDRGVVKIVPEPRVHL